MSVRKNLSIKDLVNFGKEFLAKYSPKSFTRDRFRQMGLESPIKKYFKSFTAYKNQCADTSFESCKSTISTTMRSEDITSSNEVVKEVSKNCFFNESTRHYIFDFSGVRAIGRVITLPETQIWAIQQDYSNYDKRPKTLAAIANKQKIPPFILARILHKLNFTHDSLPITNEYLASTEQEDSKIVEDLLSQRRFNIYEHFTHKTWKETQENSDKWAAFENGILNPFANLLQTWIPFKGNSEAWERVSKLLSGSRPSAKRTSEDKVFIATLSDLHIGGYADGDSCFHGDGWDSNKAIDSVISYIHGIEKLLNNMIERPKKCLVVSVGDLLDSIRGITDKGTVLNTGVKGPSQFKLALDVLFLFFTSLGKLFDEIEVKAVCGNHDSFGDWILMTTLNMAFNGIKEQNSESAQTSPYNIRFDIEQSRWLMFKEGESLFVIEHGASSKYKSKVPLNELQRSGYISKLLLSKMDQFQGKISNRYFMMGDLHHYSQKDMNSFEFIQLPSIVDSDEYADNLNLHSRPRQMCFMLDKSLGITETYSIYTYGQKSCI